MRKSLLRNGSAVLVSLFVLFCLTVSVPAGTIPGDLWLQDGETYVDLTDTNTTDAWNFPDGSDSGLTVNGNCADEKDMSSVATMQMTVTAPKANTTYYVDVVQFNRRGEEDERGFAAGFTSSSMTAYDGVGAIGQRGAYSNGSYSSSKYLSRVPLGTTTSDAGGNIDVFIGENGSLRGQVDGLIYYEQPMTSMRVISNVDRVNGCADNDMPIGTFDGGTDPIASDDGGIQLGARAASDRTFVFDYVDDELKGADYVRMFNGDKGVDGLPLTDLAYSVTFDQPVIAMVLMDERVGDAAAQQAAVDAAVADFASAGRFVDMGYAASLNANSDHIAMNAFAAYLPAGTYDFAHPGQSMTDADGYYWIAAVVPEPSTCVLFVGAVLFGLLRRRR